MPKFLTKKRGRPGSHRHSSREFVYSSFGIADDKGNISTVLPYSTKGPLSGSAVIPTESAYEVERESGAKKRLIVKEKSAANGASLTLHAF